MQVINPSKLQCGDYFLYCDKRLNLARVDLDRGIFGIHGTVISVPIDKILTDSEFTPDSELSQLIPTMRNQKNTAFFNYKDTVILIKNADDK